MGRFYFLLPFLFLCVDARAAKGQPAHAGAHATPGHRAVQAHPQASESSAVALLGCLKHITGIKSPSIQLRSRAGAWIVQATGCEKIVSNEPDPNPRAPDDSTLVVKKPRDTGSQILNNSGGTWTRDDYEVIGYDDVTSRTDFRQMVRGRRIVSKPESCASGKVSAVAWLEALLDLNYNAEEPDAFSQSWSSVLDSLGDSPQCRDLFTRERVARWRNSRVTHRAAFAARRAAEEAQRKRIETARQWHEKYDSLRALESRFLLDPYPNEPALYDDKTEPSEKVKALAAALEPLVGHILYDSDEWATTKEKLNEAIARAGASPQMLARAAELLSPRKGVAPLLRLVAMGVVPSDELQKYRNSRLSWLEKQPGTDFGKKVELTTAQWGTPTSPSEFTRQLADLGNLVETKGLEDSEKSKLYKTWLSKAWASSGIGGVGDRLKDDVIQGAGYSGLNALVDAGYYSIPEPEPEPQSDLTEYHLSPDGSIYGETYARSTQEEASSSESQGTGGWAPSMRRDGWGQPLYFHNGGLTRYGQEKFRTPRGWR